MTPLVDYAAIARETPVQVALGHRILQTHRFADSDAGQVALLLELLKPPVGAMVLDAGCGIGEVARLMAAARPDLAFVLMNLSAAQLALCPTGEEFMFMLDDCQNCLLNDGVIDCAMFSSSLCQMDTAVALAETRRILRPGGVLLVNDMAHPSGHRIALEQIIGARVLSEQALVAYIEAAGFMIDAIVRPEHDATHFNDLAAQAGADVSGIYPIIIRATARKEFQP